MCANKIDREKNTELRDIKYISGHIDTIDGHKTPDGPDKTTFSVSMGQQFIISNSTVAY